nr:Chain 52, Chlorophyll a-b binding protein 1B-21, chloroplastic [Porphyridium purpureum]7Y5E_5N Chain 5N, Chlorophyll a-b binding protein 1B-21, chloroplastic [Porphyridium purpureum]7Y7A_57 Chain 57, Chlorophyll a-b binding protein 1B-21, chloroplastic [Porphyridium purpureum]7Y7A_5o Chain 5o, Chlorophyll a-b binding protein 1B-21, chloroplastic [Porphyridium purpureum]
PFLTKPEKLDGSMAGDVGFDPLGFSNYLSLEYLRESEIKHGRVAMLACLGIWIQEIVHLPGKEFSNPLATEAFFQVPAGGIAQIFLACGLAEFIGHRGKMTYMDIAADKERKPGAMGFDPLNMSKGKSAEAMKKLELNEVKNGRLAMIGVGGLIHAMFISHQPTLFQLAHFKPL